MSAIMIKCPTTGVEIPVGIETDTDSFHRIPNDKGKTHCAVCGQEHEWKVSDAWLRTQETTQG